MRAREFISESRDALQAKYMEGQLAHWMANMKSGRTKHK